MASPTSTPRDSSLGTVVAAIAAGVAFGASLANRGAGIRGGQPDDLRPAAGEATSRLSERPGVAAAEPTDLSGKAWVEILQRVKVEMKRDNVVLLGAGVAFFAFLSLAPALVALVAIYGLVADPGEVQQQVTELLAAAPAEARTLITDQLESIAGSTNSGLGLTVAIGLLTALWSASAGVKHLIGAINAVYDETETRGFVALRGLSIGYTVGGVLALGAVVFLATIVPSILEGTPLALAGSVLRWPILALVLLSALAVLYRFGPDRSDAEWSWTAPGTLIAAVLLVAASVGFSVYTSNFGSYGQTYGSLSAVVVLMLWLMICSIIVVLGAEINAEAERQTLRDTTVGPDEPIGRRGADPADDRFATAD